MKRPPDPRTLLARYHLHAKKSWGQSFLVDTSVHEEIARAAVLAEDDWVVEIGAGLGTLTHQLAHRASGGRVLAVERDRDLAAVLRLELAGLPNVEIVEENALSFSYEEAASKAGVRLAVAGNLPYQIASPLIFGLLAERQVVKRAVFMLQSEMADRLLAQPSTKAYGALGVMVQTFADVRLLLRVAASAFYPKPNVASTVIVLEPLAEARFPLVDEQTYRQVVRACFSKRRKTLRNALRSVFPPLGAQQALAAVGIDEERRGETLSVAEFAKLGNAMFRALQSAGDEALPNDDDDDDDEGEGEDGGHEKTDEIEATGAEEPEDTEEIEAR
ncbi:MAG: 16S rRNA (adenine(1518)-N(6)/adenine(1519)-N(6))-dimethyltransferase RsmA [Pseudomonadota bacterium]